MPVPVTSVVTKRARLVEVEQSVLLLVATAYMDVMRDQAVLMLAINTVYHYHAQGFLIATTSLKQISSTFDEASAMLGGSFLHTMRKITLPIIWPTLISLGVFFFMRAMVTLAAVIFLVTPGNNLAAVSVLLLDDSGETTQAAAFSTMIMLVVIASAKAPPLQNKLRQIRVPRQVADVSCWPGRSFSPTMPPAPPQSQGHSTFAKGNRP